MAKNICITITKHYRVKVNFIVNALMYIGCLYIFVCTNVLFDFGEYVLANK